MARTRRPAAPDAVNTVDTAVIGAPEATLDSLPIADKEAVTTPPNKRRASRKTIPLEAQPVEPAVVEAPVAEPRPKGRRTKQAPPDNPPEPAVAETPPETAVAEAPPEPEAVQAAETPANDIPTPVSDTPAPKVRPGRSPRRAPTPTVIVAPPPTSPTLFDVENPFANAGLADEIAVDGGVVAEVIAEHDAEAVLADTQEAPQRTRRGRRDKAEAEISIAAAIAEEAPQLTRRGRRGKPDVVAVAPPAPLRETRKQTRRGKGKDEAATAPAVMSPIEESPEDAAVQPGQAQAAPAGRKDSSRRSRNERRRRAVQIAEDEAAIDAAVAAAASAAAAELSEAEPTEDQPRQGGRQRNRRRKERLGAPEAATEEAVTTEPAAAAEGETEEEDDDATRRSRRSRRNGRRRKMPDEFIAEDFETPEFLVMEEEAEIEEEEEDLLLPFTRPTLPVYVAPPLVPEVPALPEGSPKPRISAAVAHCPGHSLQRIVIDHHNHAPYFFFVNAEAAGDSDAVDTQVRHAASMGVHLYSTVMHLPLKNAYGDRSFGTIDVLIQQVLDADPDGYVLPRLQCVPTNFWMRTHPGETAQFSGGHDGNVSLASIEFWIDCVDAIEALIAHFADPHTPGGDRVIGFHLDHGEWFHDALAGPDLSAPNRTAFRNWLQAKYQVLYGLRAAWYDGSVTFETADIPAWHGKTVAVKKGDTPLYATAREGRWVDFSLYSSECTTSVISGLARAVKTLSSGRMIVAVSYGYTMEFASRNDSGHLAMGRLLESPDVDIIAGPNAYVGRTTGNPASFSALIDSVRMHNKLWLVEDDTKTFLAETETDDSYNPRIVSGADTRAVHQRHFGAALVHRAGVDWMDLWGQGWLNSEDIWQELGGLQDLADRWSRNAPEIAPPPEVAVIVDEASLAYVKNDQGGLNNHLILKTRDLLLRTGASIGFYLQSDVTREDFPDAKLYLFLNALRLTSAERLAIRERLQRRGKTLAWLYAPGLFDETGPTVQESGDVVGMALRRQPWNSRLGSQILDVRHPITDRLRNNRKIGQDEILNPSFSVTDPQAFVLAEYVSTGAPSFAVREHNDGWKSIFLGEPYLTTELLRGIFAYAGVSLFDVQDDIVYASNDGVLLIHAPFTGQRTFRLPQRATVYDAFENRIVATDTNTFRSFLRARTSRLFFWGTAERIAELSGIDVTAPIIHDGHHSQQQSPDPLPIETPPQPRTEVLVSEPPATKGARDADEFLASLPGMEIVDPLPLDGLSADPPPAPESEEDGGPTSSRSRWQRRRAAARARRDAERRTANPDATPIGQVTADPPPPLDIAAILPNLPPRRKSSKAAAPPTSDDTGA